MPRLAGLLLLPLILTAQERWTVFRSGPFEVLTTGGEKPARDVLTRLEQFRHAFGTTLSRPEAVSLWPIRIVMLKGAGQATSPSIVMGRDSWIAGLAQGGTVSPRWLRDSGRILLDSNAGRMRAEVEEGLLTLFSTLDIQVTRITLGAPPPAPERTPAWSVLHLLAVNPEYSGKFRVLLANLQQGMEPEPAYRNALEKTPREIEKEAAAHLAGGAPGTISLPGRAIDPDFSFPARPVEPALARVILADVAVGEAARAAYEAVLQAAPDSVEAIEGLGFAALRAKRPDEARRYFAKAVELGSRNARAHLEAGSFESAAKLNPRWAEPYLRRAAAEKESRRKVPLLAMAAKLDPRNSATWRALAEAQFENKLLGESARSWIAAERAAATEAERASLRQARMEADQRRLDAEAAERKRLADEKELELVKLKNESLERIRAAEAKASRSNPPLEPGHKVEEWWGDNTGPAGRVTGVLERVDCLRGQARLALRDEKGKAIQLLIRDPTQVVIEGGGEKMLGCGPQKPPRKLSVDYTPRPDAKLQTAGDATFVKFQ